MSFDDLSDEELATLEEDGKRRQAQGIARRH
jgi:hypothetical protein